MHIVVTGGAGFLGQALARKLLRQASINGREIGRLTLLDRALPSDEALLDDPRVDCVQGDLQELIADGRAVPDDCDAVFHLAAAVSAECEADFDLGMRSNFDATRELLDACRPETEYQKPRRFVFASSVAVFGGKFKEPVEDDALPQPQSSYGMQKFIGEQLVADYTRRGFIDGRSVRLMTVSVRGGKPNGAASGFLSGIVREPLAGQRARCPVPRDTAVALSSPAHSVEGLVRAMEASIEAWGERTAVNLPALSLTVGAMVDALERVAGRAAVDLIDWEFDETIATIIRSWPSQFAANRARGLGLTAAADFDAIIRQYQGGQ